ALPRLGERIVGTRPRRVGRAAGEPPVRKERPVNRLSVELAGDRRRISLFVRLAGLDGPVGDRQREACTTKPFPRLGNLPARSPELPRPFGLPGPLQPS